MSSFDVSAEITKIQDEKSNELLMSGIHDDSAITDIAPSENLWDWLRHGDKQKKEVWSMILANTLIRKSFFLKI